MSQPPSSQVSILKAHFSGRVQGVGFRATVKQLAKGFEVTGHVRNLADGRVSVYAEGRRAELEAFLAEIQGQMVGFIRTTDAEWSTGPRLSSQFAVIL